MCNDSEFIYLCIFIYRYKNMSKTLFILALTFLVISCSNSQELKHIDSKTFSSLITKDDGIVLDVRTPQEYSRGHIKNSTLISTSDPKFVEKVNLLQKDKPIYIYCLTGSRSRAVANYLAGNGHAKVYNLSRGLMEWQQYGYSLQQSGYSVSSQSKTYNQSEFTTILSSNKLVLVDFHAVWCAPCKKMSPVIDQVEKKYAGKAFVEKIDIEANKNLQSVYNIETVPGLVLFKNGMEVWKHTGLISYAEISEVIDEYL